MLILRVYACVPPMSRRTAQATGRHRKANRGTGQPLRVSRLAAKQWNELRPESSPRRTSTLRKSLPTKEKQLTTAKCGELS